MTKFYADFVQEIRDERRQRNPSGAFGFATLFIFLHLLAIAALTGVTIGFYALFEWSNTFFYATLGGIGLIVFAYTVLWKLTDPSR
jgi:hypothetical protein